jgi:hypothetical protein
MSYKYCFSQINLKNRNAVEHNIKLNKYKAEFRSSLWTDVYGVEYQNYGINKVYDEKFNWYNWYESYHFDGELNE